MRLGRRRGEEGTVTAEFALGLPGLVATALLILAALAAGVRTVQCLEAARAGAREAMWEGSGQRASAAAHAVAGSGARVTVSIDDGWVTVRVDKPLLFEGLPLRPSGVMRAPLETRPPPALAPAWVPPPEPG